MAHFDTLLRNTSPSASYWQGGYDVESEFTSTASESELLPMQVLGFVFGKYGFIVGASCRKQVENDPCEFMGGGSDRLGRSHFRAHATVVIPEIGLAPV
jgi:hypothetical protein